MHALLHSVPQPCSRPLPTHASTRDSLHSWASLAQSLVGSLLLSPGSWCTQAFVCSLQESVSQSCVSSGDSTVGLMATSFKRSHARTAAHSAPNLAAGHRQPTPPPETPEHSQQVWVSLLWGHCSFLLGSGRRLSNTALSQSLWGLWVLVHTRYG